MNHNGSAAADSYASVIDKLNIMVYITDPANDELLFVSDSMARSLKLPDGLCGRKCYRALRGFEERCGFCPLLKPELMRGGESVWTYDCSKTGAERAYRVTSHYVAMPDGKTVLINNAIDLTEIREMLSGEQAETQKAAAPAGKVSKTAKRKSKAAISFTLGKIINSAVLRRSLMRDAARAVDTLTGLMPKISISENISADGLDDKAVESYIISVHGMKGALANIGEAELSSAALRLELAGKERDMDVIEEETPAFIEALKAMIRELQTAEELQNIQASEPGGAADYDKNLLWKKLADIKEACEAYNVAQARPLLTELMQMSWPKQINDALDLLSTNLLHSDFDEAVKTIEKCYKL